MVSKSSLDSLASRILAAALFDCLPGLVIHEVGIAMGGFFCDFSFHESFSSEILIQLEEKIRQIIRDNLPVKVMEMVPFSASEFLKKIGQTNRARQVLSQEDYVRLIQIGPFVDWCEEPCLDRTKEVGMIRLLDKKSFGKGRFRIFGMAAELKDDLKACIKEFKHFNEWNHDQRGISESFWELVDNERLWINRGLEASRRIIDHWRKNFSSIAMEVEGNEEKFSLISKNRKNIPVLFFRRLDEPSFEMRGLLDARYPLVMEVKSFHDPVESCISFLQNAHQSLRILGLTYRIRLIGKKQKLGSFERALEKLGWKADEWVSSDQLGLEFLISDRLQCEWVVAAVVEPRKKNGINLTVWVERNLALLLEKSETSLSF